MMGELSGLEGDDLTNALQRCLGIVGMESRAHLPFASMSKGMR